MVYHHYEIDIYGFFVANVSMYSETATLKILEYLDQMFGRNVFSPLDHYN